MNIRAKKQSLALLSIACLVACQSTAFSEESSRDNEPSMLTLSLEKEGSVEVWSMRSEEQLGLVTDFGEVTLSLDRIVQILRTQQDGVYQFTLSNDDVVNASLKVGSSLLEMPDGPVDLNEINFRALGILNSMKSILGFPLYRIANVPPTFTKIQTADFNGDGGLDFAIGRGRTDKLDIYLENATLTPIFNESLPSFAEQSDVSDFQVADFNNDGRSDLLAAFDSMDVGDRNPMMVLFLGGDTLEKQPPFKTQQGTESRDHYEFVVADLNNDGNQDIVAGMLNKCALNILWGNGDGSFTHKHNIDMGGNVPRAIHTGDLNGDGWPDIATGYYRISVFLSDGLGGYQPPTTYLNKRFPEILGLTDLDQDGDLDLVCKGGKSANDWHQSLLATLVNDGTGRMETSGWRDLGFAIKTGGVVDVDGDGDEDLVVQTKNQIDVVPSNGDGTFAVPYNLSSNLAVSDFSFPDLNQDGHPDLVFLYPGEKETDAATVEIRLNANSDQTQDTESPFTGRQ